MNILLNLNCIMRTEIGTSSTLGNNSGNSFQCRQKKDTEYIYIAHKKGIRNAREQKKEKNMSSCFPGY